MNVSMAVNAMKYIFITLGIITVNYSSNIVTQVENTSNTQNFVLTNVSEKVSTVISENDIDVLLDEKADEIKFFCKTFGVKKKTIINKLKKINSGKKLKKNNIGRLKKSNGKLANYGSFEKGLIEYLFYYESKYPKKVSNKYVPYNGSAKYVEDLIKYYTSIYTNVDYLTAVSIGAAESGYYEVKYMLNYNNIYGGMSSGGLIKHKNIEYGVLSYIRMLSKYYYGKGLDTVEEIGYVYCPKKVKGGKVASPHWIKLVKTAKKYYKNSYKELTVMDLVESKNV